MLHSTAAPLRSKVQQRVDTCLVEPCHYLVGHNQGGCRANAQAEQLVPGFFVDHDIFFCEFHPFAGQILCQCCTGASEGLRIHRDLSVVHDCILVFLFMGSRRHPALRAEWVAPHITQRYLSIRHHCVTRPARRLFRARRGTATEVACPSVPVLFPAIPAARFPLLRK